MVLKRKYVKNYFASSKTDNDKSLISTNATKRFIRAYIFKVVSKISLFKRGNFFGKNSAVIIPKLSFKNNKELNNALELVGNNYIV